MLQEPLCILSAALLFFGAGKGLPAGEILSMASKTQKSPMPNIGEGCTKSLAVSHGQNWLTTFSICLIMILSM